MPARQRFPFIERKPKAVEFLEPLRRTVKLTEEQELFFLTIIRAISKGEPLPKGSYRVSLQRDELLEEAGVMHLHLGHAGSRELLYLVQYPDHVVFLEIGDHYHFKTKPRGRMLAQIHGKRLAALQLRRHQRMHRGIQVQAPSDDD